MNCRNAFVAAGTLLGAAVVVPVLAQRGLPANATILTGGDARAVFKQCSRATPSGISGYWVPAKSDVIALEASLPGFLVTQKLSPSTRDRNLTGALHQCAGFVRGGRRWIYVNGFTRRVANDMQGAKLFSGPNKGKRFDWRRDNVDVCDGGAFFWGVEYDVQKRTFQNLSFNGPG